MSSNRLCPFCNSPLICQISQGKPYWFCMHCHQEVPYGFCEHPSEYELTHDLSTNQNESLSQAFDQLTNLANHSRFHEHINQEWQRMSREQKPLSLILSDVDFFDDFSRLHGTQISKKYLQQIADIIKSSAQRPADLVARYRVHEFAIILPNTELGGAVKVAEHIRNQVQQLKVIDFDEEQEQYFTLSLGISSIFPKHPITVEILIIKTEQALAQAKAQGNNSVVCSPQYHNYLQHLAQTKSQLN